MKDFFNFQITTVDLPKRQEELRYATCAERLERIVETVTKRIRPFRMLTLPVDDGTDIWRLSEIAAEIQKQYHIECFQITVDRKKKEAFMLFDFFNQATGKCEYLPPYYQMKFSVFVIGLLDLDDFSLFTPYMIKHWLMQRYQQDHKVFSCLLEQLKPLRLSKDSYLLLRMMISYMDSLCSKQVK